MSAGHSLPEQLGDFQIVGLLGTGSTGIVYEARWGPRVVAVKVLHAEHADTPKLRQRFFEEAERFRQLSHPSVVKVLSSGELPDGRPYLALEKLDGETLEARLQRGPLSLPEALSLLRQIGGAVAALHASGLVHRDIDPSNVFLVAGGKHAVLLEMGMARDAGNPSARTTVRAYSAANTAPERVLGDRASIASDIHELALLFCMSAGLSKPSQLPKRGRSALRSALARDPQDRPKTVAELLGAVCAPDQPSSSGRKLLVWGGLGLGISAGLLFVVLLGLRIGDSIEAPASDAAPASCDNGSAAACRDQGNRYAHGDGFAIDFQKAAEFFRRACQGDDPEGCHLLGRLYQHGEGVAKNEVTAQLQYTRACDLSGGRWGCRALGNLVHDKSRAVALYEKACAAKDGTGCANLGLAYARGTGVTEDSIKGVAYWKTACDLDDATGCANLGLYTRRGIGVDKDVNAARALYARACELSNGASGCASLGELYAAGVGVEKDDAAAAELFEKACNKRSAVGCHNLAVAYGAGRGVLKDKDQARILYRQGCDLGHAPACSNLGRMLVMGEGGPKDRPAGEAMLDRACRAGNGLGCSNLAVLRRDDPAAAKAARERACKLGHKASCKLLGRMPK